MQLFSNFSVNIAMYERPEDRQLVEDILQGRKGAFEELLRAYKKLVIHIVSSMIYHSADREDICQDVFIKIFQKLSSFRHEAKLSTWIGRITYNCCLNYLEKKKTFLMEDFWQEKNWDDVEGDIISPVESAVLTDLKEKVEAEMERMPVTHRLALTLFHLDGLGYSEIAEVMNLPEGTIKSYLFRARHYLKEKLMHHYHLEEL